MKVAIIGAGVAGLAAARTLRTAHADWEITIYEKSRGFGGRVATRRREGYIFDHGAQVIKGPSPAVTKLLTEELPADALHQMEVPTWSFDSAGTIREGDAAQNAEPSFFYADGNNRLGKLLAEGLDVRREVRIGALRRLTTSWLLLDTEGKTVGEADAVLLTPPAGQVVDILNASDLDETTRAELNTELGKAVYRRCLSLALAYDAIVARPFYALVNNDRKHPIAWLALEHTKGPDRCPAGHSLLIAQMSPSWSAEQYTTPVEALTPQIAAMVEQILGEQLGPPLWADLQRWRYSQPDGSADFDRLNQLGGPHGVLFAGDYTAGKGRVHLAIEHGWKAAELFGEKGEARSQK